MKVRYINEGVFKTPEQMRQERERRDAMSDEERVANSTSGIVIPQVKRELENYMNNFEFGDNSHYYCSILDPDLFGLDAMFFYAMMNWEDIPKDVTEKKISKYSVSKLEIDGDKIHIEIEVKIIDENYKNLYNVLNPSKYIHMHDISGRIINGCCKVLDDFSVGKVKKVFAENMKLAAANYDLAYRQQKRNPIANLILSKKVVLDKIHIFGEFGDLIFSAHDKKANVLTKEDWVSKMNYRIIELKKLFSFDNAGNISIRYNFDSYLIVKVKRNYEY